MRLPQKLYVEKKYTLKEYNNKHVRDLLKAEEEISRTLNNVLFDQ